MMIFVLFFYSATGRRVSGVSSVDDDRCRHRHRHSRLMVDCRRRHRHDGLRGTVVDNRWTAHIARFDAVRRSTAWSASLQSFVRVTAVCSMSNTYLNGSRNSHLRFHDADVTDRVRQVRVLTDHRRHVVLER